MMGQSQTPGPSGNLTGVANEDPAFRSEVSDDTFQALRKTWEPPEKGLRRLSTVQNGPIALRYFVLILLLFLAAGAMAMLMRTQLIVPENNFLSPGRYNEMFTMHGTTMMYLVAVPIVAALATLILPQIIGTRDMPFPRMTQLGFWAFLFGVVFLYSSFFFGAVPHRGWFTYPPLSLKDYSPGMGMDFWLLGLGLIEVATMGGAIEMIVAILKTRAPGMSLNRIPVFAWAMLTFGFMIIFGFTPFLVGTTFLELDRLIGSQFFSAENGGNPMLFVHLFWIFGHPEVYIQFLPAAGMLSMIIPTMAGRPIVAYTGVVLSIVATGFLSFGLWVHHMFTTGEPALSMSFFTASSMTISILSGVQVFAWIATFWGGKPQFNTVALWALGSIFTFVAGGLTGVMLASVAFNTQAHDSFFVVAHFHYVLLGGVIFPVFAALYYWLPKKTGKMLSEKLGQWNFWLVFIGFHVAFFPMHLSGLRGMPRRTYTYPSDIGLDWPNFISSLGAYVIAIGFALFLLNVLVSQFKGKKAEANPWNAGTLEWASPMPLVPPPFITIPIVRSRYPLWQQESVEVGDEPSERIVRGLARSPTDYRAIAITSVADAEPEAAVWIPGTSYWPLVVAVALALFFLGVISKMYWLAGGGLVLTVASLFGWFWPTAKQRELIRPDGPAMLHGFPMDPTGTRATGWWAMALTIAILATALATTLLSYYYLRLTPLAEAGPRLPVWPPAGIGLPELMLPTTATLVLLASAGLMCWAEAGIRQGQQGRLRLGMGAAWVLGAVFVGMQAALCLRSDLRVQGSAYESIFLVTLAFHIALTVAGLLIGGFVQGQAWMGLINRWRWLPVQNAALFWYFVAAAWVLTFAVLYLSPRVI